MIGYKLTQLKRVKLSEPKSKKNMILKKEVGCMECTLVLNTVTMTIPDFVVARGIIGSTRFNWI